VFSSSLHFPLPFSLILSLFPLTLRIQILSSHSESYSSIISSPPPLFLPLNLLFVLPVSLQPLSSSLQPYILLLSLFPVPSSSFQFMCPPPVYSSSVHSHILLFSLFPVSSCSDYSLFAPHFCAPFPTPLTPIYSGYAQALITLGILLQSSLSFSSGPLWSIHSPSSSLHHCVLSDPVPILFFFYLLVLSATWSPELLSLLNFVHTYTYFSSLLILPSCSPLLSQPLSNP
jgi:hypothetical protein